MPHRLLIALLFVSCAAPEGVPDAPDTGSPAPDAGVTADAGTDPVDAGPPACVPACGEGSTCVEGACACNEGYARPAGTSACRPLSEICPARTCLEPRRFSGDECEYALAGEGTACAGTSADRCVTQFQCRSGQCAGVPTACGEKRPLVLVHGINGTSADFTVMKQRFVADGWPEPWIVLFDAKDPKWGCNVDNAAVIRDLVRDLRARTCQPRVDLVAHSMGTLSTRYFMKNLGGADVVNTYVTLGGPHHGLSSPCWAPGFLGVCVWKELCETGDYVRQLNEPPSIVGNGHWITIYGTADETIPNESSQLDGAENIVMPGVTHYGPTGLLEDAATYAEVKRVLGYDCW